MTKPDLPPLPFDLDVDTCLLYSKSGDGVDTQEAFDAHGRACYKAGLLRAAEICSNRAIKSAEFHADTEQDEIHNKATAWTLQVCAGDIRAEADKVG